MFDPDETPAERSLRGRAAGHTSWAKTPNRAARTKPGRDKFESRFEREVDPDGTLPPAERARRVKSARSAYFANLARQGAAAARERRETASQ
jgi:hypothetical protein